jgi:hypothetical protein
MHPKHCCCSRCSRALALRADEQDIVAKLAIAVGEDRYQARMRPSTQLRDGVRTRAAQGAP